MLMDEHDVIVRAEDALVESDFGQEYLDEHDDLVQFMILLMITILEGDK